MNVKPTTSTLGGSFLRRPPRWLSRPLAAQRVEQLGADGGSQSGAGIPSCLGRVCSIVSRSDVVDPPLAGK